MSVIDLRARNIRAFASEDIEDGANGRNGLLDFVVDVGIRRSRVCKEKGKMRKKNYYMSLEVVLLLLSLSLSLCLLSKSRYCG